MFEPTSSLNLLNSSLSEQNFTINLINNSLNYFNNYTNISSIEDISFILPWWRQVIWSLLFAGIVLVATGGNIIVVWIVLTNKGMRTVTNYFIVNLSIADAMVSSLNVTFSYIYMLNNDWPFGHLYCKISQFVAILSVSASVFTLMAISFDRYMAIINPLKPRMGKRSTLAIAAGIWGFSIILSFPMLIYYTTEQLDAKDGIRIVCYGEWPDGQTYRSAMENIYNVVFMLLTYFVPIGCMTYTYARIGSELWRSPSIGEYCTWRQLENIKSKRRVVKMMMVVVLIFVVCWLPYQIYFILTFYYPTITEEPYIQELYLGIYWLAMSNSMYNPIIYYWMNSRFRRGFKLFFRWCPFVRIEPDVIQRSDVASRYSCSGSPDHHRIKRIDTERSILYSCPGSPQRHRKSIGGSVRMSMYSTKTNGRNSATGPTTATMPSTAQNSTSGMYNMNSLAKPQQLYRSNSAHPQQKWATKKKTLS